LNRYANLPIIDDTFEVHFSKGVGARILLASSTHKNKYTPKRTLILFYLYIIL